jgi:molybdenum cofactor cytidylyltransferase
MEANPKSKIKYSITGLLLCAGLSGRMGIPKALLLHQGLPFPVLIIRKLLLVCREVVVVVGHEAEKVKTEIKKFLSPGEVSKVKFVLNEIYKAGMFSSLQCGLKHISNAEWILYHFVDQPSLPESFYTDFVCQLSDKENWLQPSYKGKLGHPILFDTSVAAYVLELNERNSLRDLSDDKRIKRKIWKCQIPEVFQDIDTMEEFFKLNNRI